MQKEEIKDTMEAALERYAAIAPLLEDGLSAAEITQRRRAILAKLKISERTLRRWIAAYKKDGFKRLQRQERSDKGKSKVIAPEVMAKAEEYRRELPRRSAGLICELLKDEGHTVARSTLERQLRQNGLSGKQLSRENEAKLAGTRRFVRVGRNTLWQSDIKHGPCLPDPDDPKKKRRTNLLVIIDDATRVVVHGEFYFGEKLPILEDGLRKAILKYGTPKNIYVDNGKIFTSGWFRVACAMLNIRHQTCRPYSPASKGKVERMNKTVEGFLDELSLQKASTLEELNGYFSAWLSEGYNHKPHSSLNGKTPAEVFNSDSTPLRFVKPETLADAFLHEAERTVDKTGCFKLDGKLYDAGTEWLRKKVTVRYDPFDLREIQLWYKNEMKKTVREARILEHNATQRVECEKTEEASSSRAMKLFQKKYEERFKKSMGAFDLSLEEKK